MVLENISIILNETQMPENIGFSARAMANMGIMRLVLVKPKNFDLSRIRKTATGMSVDIVEQMEVYDDLKTALKPFQYVVGTTARLGNRRPAMADPHLLASELIPISKNNKVGILFGPEDRGLSNEQLRFCQKIVTINTAFFSSLNLSHAVLIICYELFMKSHEPSKTSLPRLANSFELEGMYDHLQEVLMKIGFINPQNPEHWMNNVRRFLSRVSLRAREVKIIRGICRQIDWYTGQMERHKKDISVHEEDGGESLQG
jgi:tRNA/rRNA methyltransferase